MFSPDSFYDYLRYFLYYNKKSSILRNFETHGSLNLFNTNNSAKLSTISPFIPKNIISSAPDKYYGYCEMFDQEPIDLSMIRIESSNPQNQQKFLNNITDKKTRTIVEEYIIYLNNLLKPIDFISKFSSAMHAPIVCHSELNSDAISELSDNGYIPVHYWYHGIISLYWFQQYKLLHTNNNLTPHKFGLYARDASGTRNYRLSVLKSLSKIKKNLYFIPHEPIKSQDPTLFKTIYTSHSSANINIDSNSSASIFWPDIYNFDIHLVAETLFNTEKTHLTEKILKPIVMGQPFILFSGPFSLKYIQQYGFKTFGYLWDESYDNETNKNKRYDKIINVINHINNLPISSYSKIILQAKEISAFNRKHFYSIEFSNILINELHNALSDGYIKQQESFFSNPGGTWFSVLHDHYKRNIKFPLFNIERNRELVEYTKLHYPNVAQQIIKKYNHLL